jgi:hypothetical protein
VPEQQRQRGVLPQLRQVFTAFAAGSPEAEHPPTSCDASSPRLRRLITTLSSSTVAPLVRNASIRSGTPLCAVMKPLSAR